MKNLGNKFGGASIILIGISGVILRTILRGYHNLWDFIILLVFIITIIIGISVLIKK